MTRRTLACASAALALAAPAWAAPEAQAAGSGAAAAARADWSAGAVARGTGHAAQQGSRRVREVQRRLTRLGYAPGPVDGIFGPRTQQAATRFQERAGLVADGIVGRGTLRVLRARDDARLAARRATQPPARPAAEPGTPPAPQPAAPPATDASGRLGRLLIVIGLGLAVVMAAATRAHLVARDVDHVRRPRRCRVPRRELVAQAESELPRFTRPELPLLAAPEEKRS
jgi:peptidoglycan hydrolase-like protein with peptidoglycan-binding domain